MGRQVHDAAGAGGSLPGDVLRSCACGPRPMRLSLEQPSSAPWFSSRLPESLDFLFFFGGGEDHFAGK